MATKLIVHPGDRVEIEAAGDRTSAAEDFPTRQEALVAAKKQGRSEKDVFAAKGKFHVAAEGPADPAIPWVKVTRDPEQFRAAMDLAKAVGPIENSRSIYDLLAPALVKEDQEVFLCVLMDVRRQLRGVAEVARGQRSAVTVGIADIMRVVVTSGAESFVVAHNHPSTQSSPSRSDRKLTTEIRKAFQPLAADCTFADHVILAPPKEYFSFADNKVYHIK